METVVGYVKSPCTIEDPKYQAGVVSLGLIQNHIAQPKEPSNRQHARQSEPVQKPEQARTRKEVYPLPLFHGRKDKNDLKAWD